MERLTILKSKNKKRLWKTIAEIKSNYNNILKKKFISRWDSITKIVIFIGDRYAVTKKLPM